jgi:hypothetical protein
VAIGTAATAVRDTAQNLTPGGSGSALIEDTKILEVGGGAELPAAYQVLQRAANSRIAVQAGKTYNVYLHVKAENWVTPEHRDAVHYQLVWRNAASAVIGTIFSHPHWLYPQPYWYHCNLGHPEGADSSITLARLTPPAGAASLDIRVGWLRTQSETNPDTQADGNPAGSLLYVDDLVVDAVASTVVEPTISISRTGNQISINYEGTLESTTDITTGWTAVQGASSPYPVTAAEAKRFYRAKQ